jgi:predicted RNase H-like HicB family nuclease
MMATEPLAQLIYPATLTTEAGRTLVSFPDCPDCRTFAEPGEDVLPIAQHALAGRLAAAIQDGTEPPLVAYRWPTPPWDALLYGGMVMMVVTPVLFYPFSKDLFLAFDLIFRPPAPEDFG